MPVNLRGISKVAKNYQKYLKFVVLASALPFIYGCGAGAGIGSLVGFLFGSGLGGSIGDIVLLGGGGGGGVGGGGIASLTQPEPATMLLLGSGLMTMSYFKAKAGRRNKK